MCANVTAKQKHIRPVFVSVYIWNWRDAVESCTFAMRPYRFDTNDFFFVSIGQHKLWGTADYSHQFYFIFSIPLLSALSFYYVGKDCTKLEHILRCCPILSCISVRLPKLNCISTDHFIILRFISDFRNYTWRNVEAARKHQIGLAADCSIRVRIVICPTEAIRAKETSGKRPSYICKWLSGWCVCMHEKHPKDSRPINVTNETSNFRQRNENFVW